MEITIKQSNYLKVIAILMMLCLHLFNREYKGLFQPLIFIGEKPFSYYISLFCDACVPIFAFVSGYGLYYKYIKNTQVFFSGNIERLKKLYLNLWIVILIFPILLGLLLQKSGFPGSLAKLMMNLTAIRVSYSSIWWYFTTYVLVVMTSPFLFYVTKKYNSIAVLTLSFVVYLIAFYFRVYKTEIFTNDILKWIHFQSARYGLVQFEFLLGALALKDYWNHRFAKVFGKVKFKNTAAIILIIVLIVIRALLPNFFFSPFSALAFILVWNQISIGKWMTVCLDFFTPHATNIWLCHSFFYTTFFKEFIYSPELPILIFFLLLICSLISSWIINYFYNKFQRYI